MYFAHLPRHSFPTYGKSLFDILYSNMNLIAPYSRPYEEELADWLRIYGGAFTHGKNRQIVLILDDDTLIGFFGYNIADDTFEMEEIQLHSDYHGKGIFRELYTFVLEILPAHLKSVEAYAHKTNSKSIGILTWLGLSAIGENNSGDCYHFIGKFSDLVSRFNSPKK